MVRDTRWREPELKGALVRWTMSDISEDGPELFPPYPMNRPVYNVR